MSLEDMSREQLAQYAKEHGIKLYTRVPSKMIKQIREVEYVRKHHGDAFCTEDMLKRRYGGKL